MASKELKGVHKYAEMSGSAVLARVEKMVQYRNEVDVENAHVKISYENRKTTALVPSVSLLPIADCGNCAACSKGCYAVRNLGWLPIVQKAWANNSAIARKDPKKFFSEVSATCRFLRFFRWFVSGDIISRDFFDGMVQVALDNPKCQFLVFTKMFEIVNGWMFDNGSLPENMHVIFSDWRHQLMNNPHNLPVSSPLWKDGTTGTHVTKNRTMCPGNCAECAETNNGCWAAKPGDTILFEAH